MGVVTSLRQFARVASQQVPRLARRVRSKASLVERETATSWIKAAEVKEYQWMPVAVGTLDLPSAVQQLRRAFVEVPIGHIAAGMAQDSCCRHEERREIHPLLVGKHAFTNVRQAHRSKVVVPPRDEATAGRRVADRGEAEIVESRAHDVEIARKSSILWQRREKMRRERHVGIAAVA